MNFRIRRAIPADLPHLVKHRRAMFEAMGHQDPIALANVDAAALDYFQEALAKDTYVGWLAEEEATGRVLGGGGIVIAHWPGHPSETHARRAWILNMYTEPDVRGQGIARKILAEILQWSRQQGFSILSLHASDAGRSLYESLGFQPTNEMRLKL